jgi:thiol-disulfide isomerase/thioredoxin
MHRTHLPLLAALSLPLACSGGEEHAPDPASLPVGSVQVSLEAQVPERGSDRWLMWSPYGKQLPLEEVDGGLATELSLGPEGTPPIGLKLMKSPDAIYFDLLGIDLDRDGDFGAGESLETTPTERNHRFWSSFDAVVDVPVIDPATGEEARNSYPLGFWYVEDPRITEEEPVLRYSRHGYMEGRAVLDSVEAVVLLTENVMDGVFGTEDSWALASVDSAGDVLKPGFSRPMEEHAWLFDKAYRVSEVDPSGRRVVLSPFDPGITRSEEEEMNDDLKVDREAPRSGRTVAFHRDFAEAERLAQREGRRLFIDFETTWCGPCKIMDEWVYTADQVVEAAVSVVSVKVDGDERLDLKERFGVSGFPTLILLDQEGQELRRASGYVNVADMTDFLRPGR